MTINPARGQYRQVADLIRAAIERGDYPRGSALPREDELAERFGGINRTTVNKALRILSAEGLVQPLRGKGTFVSKIPPINRNAVARYSQTVRERANGRGAFDAEITALGMVPRSDLRVERVQPPAKVAKILGVSPDEVSAVIRARQMFADDVPVQIADSYIPLDIASGTPLEEEDSGQGGIISRFAELGYAQARITEHVTVRTPTPEEAQFLKLTEDQRVYDVTHVGRTADGRAVEVCLHVMPTHQWEFDYEWSADTPSDQQG
jgi:GntR family transcriptional regulator